MGAGTDTTAISVEWAMAELIKNPRVQHKAQEELDRVIEFERVMTEADFSSLPLQKYMKFATCILTRVRHCTRVKMFATSILTRVLRVSDVKDSNCTF